MYSLELSVYFFYLKKITVRFQIEYIPAYLSNRKSVFTKAAQLYV